MEKRAYAKINLGLDILRKRTDGYHDIATVMQRISLHDLLFFERSERTEIRCNVPALSLGEDNLIRKAARALEGRIGRSLPFSLNLEKRIPLAAGLAGGSTDAAATLSALNELYELGLSVSELQAIGRSVGADVPFCLSEEPCCFATGIGDVLTPIQNRLRAEVLLVNPGIEVRTSEVYRTISPDDFGGIDFSSLRAVIEKGDLVPFPTENVMERVVFPKHPEVAGIKKELAELSALSSFMSGSGSTVCGLFEDAAEAKRQVEKRHPEYFIEVCSFL